MGYFPVRYDSRVVIYEHKMFIRLATDVVPQLADQLLQLLLVHGSNPDIGIFVYRGKRGQECPLK